jgi:hypothetical protein
MQMAKGMSNAGELVMYDISCREFHNRKGKEGYQKEKRIERMRTGLRMAL